MRTKYLVAWHLRLAVFFTAAALLVGLQSVRGQQQTYDNVNRARVRTMLQEIQKEIRKSYYDPSFRGLDLDAHFKRANDKLEQATSLR